jgi:hypothetical protein
MEGREMKAQLPKSNEEIAMRYLSIYTPDPKTAAAPPSKEHMDAMGKLIEESMKSGELISTGGLHPLSKGGARLRRSDGEITVLDGPYIETKELFAGWAVLEAASKEAALEMAKRFLKIAGDGECEIRQMMEPAADCAPRTQRAAS